MKKYLAIAGIEGASVHALRHTFATQHVRQARPSCGWCRRRWGTRAWRPRPVIGAREQMTSRPSARRAGGPPRAARPEAARRPGRAAPSQSPVVPSDCRTAVRSLDRFFGLSILAIPPSSAGIAGAVVAYAVERGVGWMLELAPGQRRVVLSREGMDTFGEARAWDHPTPAAAQAAFRRFRELLPACLLGLAR